MERLRAVGAVGESGVLVGPWCGRLEEKPTVRTTREKPADGAYWALAMAESGVETVPVSSCTPVLMLSQASSVEGGDSSDAGFGKTEEVLHDELRMGF